MCVVVDANTLSCVFKSSNVYHKDFIPILKWILFGKAKLSLGGKLFTEEIAVKQSSFMNFIKELGRLKKIHFFDNSEVDEKMAEVKGCVDDSDFDDPHIIALLIVSKATVLCSNDQRLFKFVPQVKRLSKGVSDPKIYTSIGHKPQCALLCDENICSCGKHKLLPQKTAEKMLDMIENK